MRKMIDTADGVSPRSFKDFPKSACVNVFLCTKDEEGNTSEISDYIPGELLSQGNGVDIDCE
jgi:hypothetical protein